MKIFISWSGERSGAIATLLNDWIKCVIQASKPWISTRDIDRGALWFNEIGDQLRATSVGVICLTHENKDRPWILFEAGALAKGLSSSRVCTFLIDLKSTDLVDPLAQFNHTFPNKESMWGLVRTLNASADQAALDERVLQQVFETYWPQFEKAFDAALARHSEHPKTKPRAESDVLDEILSNTRALNHRIRALEAHNAETPVNPVQRISDILDDETTNELLKRWTNSSAHSAFSLADLQNKETKISAKNRLLAAALRADSKKP